MKQYRNIKKKRTSRYNIEALARGLEVLELFTAENPSLSLSEIVNTLNLNKSTTFRLLSTLESMGYLERESDNRRYYPSLKVLQLGFTAINRQEVRQVARPYLERLSQEAGETVSLCVLNGIDVIYIDRIRNRAIVGVVLEIGSHVPAHCTSMGKVLLADLPDEDLDKLFEQKELIQYTKHTITSRKDLYYELLKVRKNGYAVCDGELAIGLVAAGAPIRNSSQKTIAAINISGSVSSISTQRLKQEIIPAVIKTANQISMALGYISDTNQDKGIAS